MGWRLLLFRKVFVIVAYYGQVGGEGGGCWRSEEEED